MSNSLPLNPFLSVRPRSTVTAPAKPPKKGNRSRAPVEGNVLLLDTRGRRTVGIEPLQRGAITIPTQAQSAAMAAKQARIKKGMK